jgi:hypothetical protein
MRSRQVLVILVIVAVGVGSFFGGRASVSQVSVSVGTTLPSNSVVTHFDPASVTFVSLDTGWTLGTAPCARNSTCLALRKTTNEGRSWSTESLPASLLNAADRKVGGALAALYGGAGLNVRFANARDGWIYGSLAVSIHQSDASYIGAEAILWSTHDGGLTWRKQPLPWVRAQGTILDLEANAGTVFMMAQNKTFTVTVESSPVGEDDWRASNAVGLGVPAGGGQLEGAIVLEGSNAWLVEGNDRGTSGSARLASNGQWLAWTPPCASVGDSLAVPAASTTNNLVAVCEMGGFASPLSKSAPRGATVGSSWLYFSTDDGRTFRAGPELRPLEGFFYGLLASPTPRVIVVSGDVGDSKDLTASFDGGIHWTNVFRGQLFFLGFTSATQGVGLVRSSKGANTMIMTFDGGHHWSPVTF